MEYPSIIFNKKVLKWGMELAAKTADVSIATILTQAGVDALSSAYAGQTAGTLVELLFNFSNEIEERSLSNLERTRASAELIMICGIIKEKLDAGESLRTDSFFQNLEDDRSAAEEILEGVLFAAQFEHEQKKLSYYANLVANMAFDQSIDRGQADFLLRVGKKLSYRQLCLIAILYQKEKYTISIENNGRVDIYQEIFDLFTTGICYKKHDISSSSGAFKNYKGIQQDPVDSYTDIEPKKMYLDTLGEAIFKLMKLNLLPNEDVLFVVDLL